MKKKIKTFQDACIARGYDHKLLPDVSKLPKSLRDFTIANYKMAIICEAINDGRKPNWNDHNECKYFAWFGIKASKAKPSGFGFSTTPDEIWSACTHAGSRFAFFSREDALYVGKQFKEIYKHIILY